MDSVTKRGATTNQSPSSLEKQALNKKLIKAVQNKDRGTVLDCLKHGANSNITITESNEPLIVYATKHSQANIVEQLIKYHADVDAIDPVDGNTSLIIAAKKKSNSNGEIAIKK